MGNLVEILNPMPILLKYTFYPFVLLFTLATAYGLTLVLQPKWFLLIPLILTIGWVILFIALELKYPYNPKWNKSKGDFKTDLFQTFFTLPFAAKLGEWCIPLFLYYPIKWLQGGGTGIQPIVDNIALQFIVVLLACELLYYWTHRFSHTLQFLWRFHAVHHGAKRVYWANSGRFHLADAYLGSFAYYIPLVLLGASDQVIIMILSFSAITGFMEHINIDFRAGFLNYIFNTAELHRWHHSEVMEESNHNYGKALIVWDILFGTFYWPKRKVGRVGIIGEEVPVSFKAQMLYPFKSKKQKRQ